jgi:hypothetical protein
MQQMNITYYEDQMPLPQYHETLMMRALGGKIRYFMQCRSNPFYSKNQTKTIYITSQAVAHHT